MYLMIRVVRERVSVSLFFRLELKIRLLLMIGSMRTLVPAAQFGTLC